MPTFCRHNRLVQNCSICAREQNVQARPIVTGGSATAAADAPRRPREPGGVRTSTRARSGSRGPTGVKVRHLARGADDGFRSELVPGLKSSADAERLADELAWAATRIDQLAAEPPGLYAEVADPAGDAEERTWLAFLIALVGPTDGDDPFAEIAQVRTTWASAETPTLGDALGGPRSSLDSTGAARAIDAYRAWARRSGSQAAGLTGDAAWTPERRFARAYERLGLPGLQRGARYDLLVTLGACGVYEMRAGTLALGGGDAVTVAAKRVLGIGDPILLERRATALAGAAELPLAALDAGLFNWERGERARLGMPAQLAADPAREELVRSALGL